MGVREAHHWYQESITNCGLQDNARIKNNRTEWWPVPTHTLATTGKKCSPSNNYKNVTNSNEYYGYLEGIRNDCDHSMDVKDDNENRNISFHKFGYMSRYTAYHWSEMSLISADQHCTANGQQQRNRYNKILTGWDNKT